MTDGSNDHCTAVFPLSMDFPWRGKYAYFTTTHTHQNTCQGFNLACTNCYTHIFSSHCISMRFLNSIEIV